jgi:hypothetical protein
MGTLPTPQPLPSRVGAYLLTLSPGGREGKGEGLMDFCKSLLYLTNGIRNKFPLIRVSGDDLVPPEKFQIEPFN